MKGNFKEIEVRKKTNSIYLILLIAVVLFHGAFNYIWLKHGSVSGGCDVAIHLGEYIRFRIEFEETPEKRKPENLKDIIWNPRSSNWPRTVYMISWFITKPFPVNHFFFIWINGIFFLGIVIIGTFVLGKQLYNRNIGLLSAVFISFSPGIYGLSRKYGIDLPLVAIMPLCIWAFNKFSLTLDTKNSIILGCLLGLAILIKLQVVFFLFVPVFFWFLKMAFDLKYNFSKHGKNNIGIYKAFFNVFLIILISISLSSLWWGNHLGDIFNNFLSHLNANNGNVPSGIQTDNIYLENLFYIIVTPGHLSIIISFLFLIAVCFFKKKEWKTFATYVIPPFLIFSLCFKNRWARYLFPLYPILIILISSAIFKLKHGKIKILIATLIITALVVDYYSQSFQEIPIIKNLNPFKKYSFCESWAHISYPSNYIKAANSFSNTIQKDYKKGDVVKIGLVESEIFWDCDGFPLIDYLLRSKLGHIEIYGDKRDPELFFSNYKDMNYFIIIEQAKGLGRNIDNIFNSPEAWISLGDKTFRKKNKFNDVIEYIGNSALLKEEIFYPENLKVYLLSVHRS